MAPTAASALPPVPPHLTDAGGHPRFGTYAGELNEVSLAQLSPTYGLAMPLRALRRKAWHYTLLSTPELLAVQAVADLGYAANAFVCAVDLSSQAVLIDEGFLGVPGPLASVGDRPGRGLHAHFYTLGASFGADRPAGAERYRIECSVSGLRRPRQGAFRLAAEVLAAGGPPPLTVVAPVPEGVVNVTQKSAALLAFGKLQVGGRQYELDGGVAAMDYTQGVLARKTAWRWACGAGRLADGTPLGFNLVEGFNEGREDTNENAFWLGSRLLPLGRARFTFHREEVLDTWTVRTTDDALELTFKPIYAHRDERNLVVIQSRFIQVLGTFSGSVLIDGKRYPLDQVPGVTEDQEMVW